MTASDVNQRLDIAIKEVDLAVCSPQQRAEVASTAPLEHIMEVLLRGVEFVVRLDRLKV